MKVPGQMQQVAGYMFEKMLKKFLLYGLGCSFNMRNIQTFVFLHCQYQNRASQKSVSYSFITDLNTAEQVRLISCFFMNFHVTSDFLSHCPSPVFGS